MLFPAGIVFSDRNSGKFRPVHPETISGRIILFAPNRLWVLRNSDLGPSFSGVRSILPGLVGSRYLHSELVGGAPYMLWWLV